MSEENEEDHIRYTVMVAYRKTLRDDIENRCSTHGIPLSEAVANLQLLTIYLYESLKQGKGKKEALLWEYEEVAVLDLIMIVATEITYTR